MLLVLPGVTFKHFIAYDPDDYKPAMVGDRYYLWGNPSLIADQYREGYISGTLIPPNNEGVMLSPKIMLISGPVVGGDSGSAIFAEDGRVVGTLTWGIDGGLFGGFYPLAFTKQQVLQAEGLGTFTYGPEEVKPIPPIPPAVTVNVPPVDNSPLYLIAVILLFPLIMKIFTLLRFVKRPAAYLWRLMKFIRAGFKSAVRVAREI
jgi:hypothetical protein